MKRWDPSFFVKMLHFQNNEEKNTDKSTWMRAENFMELMLKKDNFITVVLSNFHDNAFNLVKWQWPPVAAWVNIFNTPAAPNPCMYPGGRMGLTILVENNILFLVMHL